MKLREPSFLLLVDWIGLHVQPLALWDVLYNTRSTYYCKERALFHYITNISSKIIQWNCTCMYMYMHGIKLLCFLKHSLLHYSAFIWQVLLSEHYTPLSDVQYKRLYSLSLICNGKACSDYRPLSTTNLRWQCFSVKLRMGL